MAGRAMSDVERLILVLGFWIRRRRRRRRRRRHSSSFD